MYFIQRIGSQFFNASVRKCFITHVRYDVGVVGAGILGMSTARELKLRYPLLNIAVFESKADIALGQSKISCGVIYSGIFCAPGSLKAKLCVDGSKKLLEYLTTVGVPFRKQGKLIIAVTPDELPKLDELMENAQLNGCSNVSMVSGDEIKEIEPHCSGLKAIYSPDVGVVDFKEYLISLTESFIYLNGAINFKHYVDEICESTNPDYPVLVRTNSRDFECKYVVSCVGSDSDRIANASGSKMDIGIIPIRSDYFLIDPVTSHLVKGNVFPVPSEGFPFPSMHMSRCDEETLMIGPNSIMHYDRQFLPGWPNFSHIYDILKHPGLKNHWVHYANHYAYNIFLNTCMRYLHTHLQKYVPSIEYKNIVRHQLRLRAQAVGLDGKFIDDFIIENDSTWNGKRVVYLRNAPSTAGTSSLAVASILADHVKKGLNLPAGEDRISV